jgi:hypothetical protein
VQWIKETENVIKQDEKNVEVACDQGLVIDNGKCKFRKNYYSKIFLINFNIC